MMGSWMRMRSPKPASPSRNWTGTATASSRWTSFGRRGLVALVALVATAAEAVLIGVKAGPAVKAALLVQTWNDRRKNSCSWFTSGAGYGAAFSLLRGRFRADFRLPENWRFATIRPSTQLDAFLKSD